ncbi:MAG: PQQ-like beta-propeller repeat protein [Pirellulales bacterium]|nr:PQQ-like beta-propeller repeat protein [Pirellulales bacterium]
MPRLRLGLLVAVSCVFGVASACGQENWPQFRGPRGDGTVESARFPHAWSPTENIAWKVGVPGSGWAQPVVWGQQVFVLTAVSTADPEPKKAATNAFTGPAKPPEDSYRWELACFDLAGGQEQWRQQIAEQQPPIPAHVTNTYATETPATDGKHVVVWLASIGKVFAYRVDGELAWSVDLGVHPMQANLGTGSSPVIVGDLVYVQWYNEEDSFLVALETATGQERWRAPRSKGTSWATPFVWRNSVRTELVACGNTRVYSYDLATGQAFWELGNFPSSFASSPTAQGDALFLGNNGPFSTAPLFSVKAGKSGDISLSKKEAASKELVHNDGIAWWRVRSGPGLASPVVAGPRLYVSEESILACYAAATGERLYRERLPDGKDVVASPLVLEDRILLIDGDGTAFFVAAEPEFKILGTNRLNEQVWATPAVAGDALLVRGVEHLYCIRAQSAAAAADMSPAEAK